MKRKREIENDKNTNDSFHSDLEDMQEEEFKDVFDREFVFLSKRLQQSGEELLCIKNHFASFVNKVSESFFKTNSEKNKMKKCIHAYLEFRKIFNDINQSLSLDELPDIKQLLYEDDSVDEEDDEDIVDEEEDEDSVDEEEDEDSAEEEQDVDEEDDGVEEEQNDEEENETEEDESHFGKDEGSISSEEEDNEEKENDLDMGSFNFYNWFEKHVIPSTSWSALQYEEAKREYIDCNEYKPSRDGVRKLKNIVKRFKKEGRNYFSYCKGDKINIIGDVCRYIIKKDVLNIPDRKRINMKRKLIPFVGDLNTLAIPGVSTRTKRNLLIKPQVGNGIVTAIASVIIPAIISSLIRKKT